MRLHCGTSGFAYKEWRGSFYPEALPDSKMLPYYAERLGAVEINNTFYRLPKSEVVRGWAEQTPEGFSIVLKASRRITHTARLKPACADALGFFYRSAEALEDRRGPMLFQLPPNLKKDVERLKAFLALLPPDHRAALEVRHESWHDDEVYEALRAAGAALCIADTGELDTPLVATAPFGYLRLRRQEYADDALRAWAARVREQPWKTAHVFFKHDDGDSPRLALRFTELFAS